MTMMDQLPKISVAMCTYNGERFLAEQLDSILNQTYKNIELVVVDDVSTDGTLRLLDEYAARDGRIRVIRNSENIGFVRNFEKAMGECSGEFIALADQDDIWFPEKIETLYSEIGESWLIYSEVSPVDFEGNLLDISFPNVNRLEGRCPLALMLNNCVTGHASLIRRELLHLAMPAMSEMPFHDQWLAIVAASRGKLKASNKVLSFYRQHENNAVWKTKSKRTEAKYLKTLRDVERVCEFIRTVLAANILIGHDQDLLEEFYVYYSRYDRVFYNFKLRLFLKKHGDTFLALFPQQEKYRRRICRGKWYFIFLAFW
ncbi:glycosyl transferase family protein [gamma proteobacterium BDW918]|nr:glycosyl transferase family protein [gamma proteobacterium BDW918]